MERLNDLTQAIKSQSGRFTAGRFLQSLCIGKGEAGNALAFAEEQRQWLDRSQIVGALKSAVSPIDTGDYPGALVPVADSFLAAMRDASIPLRLQGLRRVPMLTRLFINSAGVIAAQVAEGQPIPVLQGDWTATTLTPRKFAAVIVQTDELMRLLSPVAAAAITDDLARATAVAENDAFLNADMPGSVLYGQTGLTAAGSVLTNVDSDLKLLIAAVRGASDPNATFVMSKTTATYVGLLRGSGGAAAFPDIGPSGGRLLGLQVLISTAAEDADSPSSRIIALLSPSEILWADEGRVTLTTSNAAALEMTDSPSPGSTNLVSMWQSNCTATRAIRESAWYARAGATAFLRVSY